MGLLLHSTAQHLATRHLDVAPKRGGLQLVLKTLTCRFNKGTPEWTAHTLTNHHGPYSQYDPRSMTTTHHHPRTPLHAHTPPLIPTQAHARTHTTLALQRTPAREATRLQDAAAVKLATGHLQEPQGV